MDRDAFDAAARALAAGIGRRARLGGLAATFPAPALAGPERRGEAGRHDHRGGGQDRAKSGHHHARPAARRWPT